MTQAGFHTSAATRKFDGYQTSVHISGLPAGGAVGFIVQVACMPAPTPLVYRLRIQVFSARGRPVQGKACQAGICLAGATAGGTRVENVTQAGFHAHATTGKFDGYQASFSLSTLPRIGKVRLVLQAHVSSPTARRPTVPAPRSRRPATTAHGA